VLQQKIINFIALSKTTTVFSRLSADCSFEM
jgi:hypothetical protein